MARRRARRSASSGRRSEWEIEARRASFVITETGFTITPEGILTHRDRAFLLEHLDETKRLVNYEADDAHLHEA